MSESLQFSLTFAYLSLIPKSLDLEQKWTFFEWVWVWHSAGENLMLNLNGRSVLGCEFCPFLSRWEQPYVMHCGFPFKGREKASWILALVPGTWSETFWSLEWARNAVCMPLDTWLCGEMGYRFCTVMSDVCVPALDSSAFLTVGIISSCLPGIVDVVSSRHTRGENAIKCQSISK